MDRRDYLDRASRGEVTEEETLEYLETCYMLDHLSRDSRAQLSKQIQSLRVKLGKVGAP